MILRADEGSNRQLFEHPGERERAMMSGIASVILPIPICRLLRTTTNPNTRLCHSFLACTRTGRSGSASFHIVKKA